MSDACKLCKGACCESILIPIQNDSLSQAFWSTRGRLFSMYDQGFVELENRCKHLEGCGSCGIYPDRPVACKIYEVGSEACLTTIKARRADQAESIVALINQTKK